MFSKYIFKNILKIKSFFKSYFFCYLFVFLLFIFIFWLIFYFGTGIAVANEKTICILTVYFLEILLSVDNVFVWFLIFKSFKVPLIYQKKVLLYGLWGAFFLRFICSFFGNVLFVKWHWILYCFGIFFILTGFKLIFFSKINNDDKEKKTEKIWIYKFFRVTKIIKNKKFFVKIGKKTFITPLFVSLLLIELSDIIFSIDSIPAAFSITNNLFIIFSSNFFAVLILRSMYFFIVNFIKSFPMMKYAVSSILIFLGLKILTEKFFSISIFFTFSIILSILIVMFLMNIICNLKK